MLTNVVLGGRLAEDFGERFVFDIDTPADIFRMLDANFSNFTNWIRKNLDHYGYAITCVYDNGKIDQLSEHELGLISSHVKEIHINPVVFGAGNDGNIIKLIVGIVIIAVVTYLTWGTGTPQTVAALGSTATGLSATSMALISVGVGLTLSGITGMMASTPSSDYKSKEAKSYFFNGAQNTVGQGYPVPIIYGEKMLVGSHTISLAVTTENIDIGDAE